MVVIVLLRYSHSAGIYMCTQVLAWCSQQVAFLRSLVKVILSTGVRPSQSCPRSHLDLMINYGVNNYI